MTTKLLPLLALIAGCSGTVKVATDPHAMPEVEEACDFLELECEHTSKTYGAIEIEISDDCLFEGDPVLGFMVPTLCEPQGCSQLDPWTLAHEIGHALNLEHVEDLDNIMHASRTTDEPTILREQLVTVSDAAVTLDACRP